MKGKNLYGVVGVLAAVVAVVPLTVCGFVQTVGRRGGTGMGCHTAVIVASSVGIAIVAAVVILAFIMNVKSIAVPAGLLAGGVAAFAVPRALPLCPSVTMGCRVLMLPTLTLLGPAIVIMSLALVLISRKTALSRKGAPA
ncbi:MAG: DUF4418 family protein [Treponema sp.]|nr:DUF4418 family protein [Treponema sp.]